MQWCMYNHKINATKLLPLDQYMPGRSCTCQTNSVTFQVDLYKLRPMPIKAIWSYQPISAYISLPNIPFTVKACHRFVRLANRNNIQTLFTDNWFCPKCVLNAHDLNHGLVHLNVMKCTTVKCTTHGECCIQTASNSEPWSKRKVSISKGRTPYTGL